MAIMGLLEGIIAIWSSVTCCTIPEALPINPEFPTADVVPQPLAVPPNGQRCIGQLIIFTKPTHV